MSDTLRALREQIEALPYAAVLLSDVLALVDAALLDAAARAPQEAICGNGYHFADDGAASCACGARAVSPAARAPQEARPVRCVCGHNKATHPMGTSEALTFNGGCLLCGCMAYAEIEVAARAEGPRAETQRHEPVGARRPISRSLLEWRADWYANGCDGLEDREGYWTSGDLLADVASDLRDALKLSSGLPAAPEQP